MSGGSEKCYFESIWERNFVNVTFLRILVMQATGNVITDEIAEVEFFQKITFRIVRTPREELDVQQRTQSMRKYAHALISYDCVAFKSWGNLSTKSYHLSIKQSI